MHYALTFDLDENWIGGSIYMRNLVAAMGTLPEAVQPYITTLSEHGNSYKFLEDTGYEKLTWVRRSQFNKQPEAFPFDAIFPWPIQNQEYRGVTWIPDLQELNLPYYFSKEEIRNRQTTHRQCFTTAGLIVSSEAVKNDVERYYPGECKNLRVVHFASFNKFNFSHFHETTLNYSIKQPYIICPNQVWIHKNHIVVIKAVALLKSRGININVYFTGNEKDYRIEGYSSTLKELIIKWRLDDQIRFLGFIPREDQLVLMKGAQYVLQPSLFEGWSTVIEDAKAMGQYVVASDIDVHIEQLPINGTFFERNDPCSLARILEKFATTPPNITEVNYSITQQNFAQDFVTAIESFISIPSQANGNRRLSLTDIKEMSIENIRNFNDVEPMRQQPATPSSPESIEPDPNSIGLKFTRTNKPSATEIIHLMFDHDWYFNTYNINDLSVEQCLDHFINHGQAENKSPSLLFDPEYYVELYPDVTESGRSPFLHFIEIGIYENRKPNRLFDPDYYRRQIPEPIEQDVIPFVHFLEKGLHSNLSPHPLFDPEYYLRNNSLVANSNTPAYLHFLRIGLNAGLNPHPLFDPSFYYETHPFLQETALSPFAHFLKCGLINGDQPHILFDPKYYTKTYPNSADFGKPALIHYLENGIYDGNRPHFMFDPDLYLAENTDILTKDIIPLLHYVEFGLKENRKPHPLFDPIFYLQSYEDIFESGMNPLCHFLNFGIFENRKPHILFDPKYYCERYHDVEESDLTAFQHFLEIGMFEQRSPNKFFNATYYKFNNYIKCLDNKPLFLHYLITGQNKHLRPSLLFDPEFYMHRYPDVASSKMLPLHHFILHGESERRLPNPKFDMDYNTPFVEPYEFYMSKID